MVFSTFFYPLQILPLRSVYPSRNVGNGGKGAVGRV